MFTKTVFKNSCQGISHLNSQGRCGPVNLGDYSVLCYTPFGDAVMIDSRDFQSLKFCYILPVREIAFMSLLHHLLQPGICCADIGAGCGFYGLAMASQVGKEGKVYCFESDAERFALLQRNTALNDYASIVTKMSVPQMDDYFSEIDEKPQLIHIAAELPLTDVIAGMLVLLKEQSVLKIICHIEPQQMLQDEAGYQRLFGILTELKFGGYLLPNLHLLESERQLTYDNSLKTVLLTRQELFEHDR